MHYIVFGIGNVADYGEIGGNFSGSIVLYGGSRHYRCINNDETTRTNNVQGTHVVRLRLTHLYVVYYKAVGILHPADGKIYILAGIGTKVVVEFLICGTQSGNGAQCNGKVGDGVSGSREFNLHILGTIPRAGEEVEHIACLYGHLWRYKPIVSIVAVTVNKTDVITCMCMCWLVEGPEG